MKLSRLKKKNDMTVNRIITLDFRAEHRSHREKLVVDILLIRSRKQKKNILNYKY